MLATRPLSPFHREIDHRPRILLGLRLLVVFAMVAASLTVVPLAAQAAPDPHFGVDPSGDQVWGGEWAPDSSITVDVYESDESTLKGSASVVADGDGQFNVDLFALTVPVDVVAGDFVEVSDGVVVKDHTVTGLELTAVDDVADTVSGLAALGSSVWVNIHESGVADTVVVADGTTGVWVATFTGLIDPDTQGYAYQPDVDGDQTQINWPAPPPRQGFNVFVDELMVHAYQWADGVSVDLMVQHPDGVGGWDPAFHTDSQTSGVAPWDPSQTFAEFVIPDTVGVGDLVTVSGDGITKDHVVRDVSFTVDTDFDTVSGTGSPFADINVNIHDDPGAQRHEVADGAGGFVADFATPGDEDYEQDVYDITVGTSGNVSEADVDGDQTTYYFGPPRNSFRVDPAGDQIQGGEWTPGAVTVSITGAAGSPWTATADLNGDFWLDLAGVYDVVAGDFVEVSDGVVVKDHTVTGLELTAVDDVADTVSGLAALGSSVWVNIHESGVADTVVVADGTTGVWVATFTGLIDPDTQGYAYQPDVDGDQTQINWPAPPPRQGFNVFVDELMVHAYQWADGVSVDLMVQHPDGVGGWDPAFHTDSQTSGVAPWDPSQTFAEFVIPDTVGVGDLVTVSGDGITKDHVVLDVSFTVDTDFDTVSGTGSPFADINVNIHDDPGAQRHEVADGAGGFVADFATPGDEDYEQDVYDITVGTSGNVSEADVDGDQTTYYFGPPEQNFSVFVDALMVYAYQWADGVSVDLMVQHPDGVGGWDPAFHTDSQTSGVAPWDPSQTFAEFVIPDTVGVGDLVTVSGDGITKDHVVRDVSFTVDTDFDTVSGTGSPFADINVNIHDDPGAQRHEVADGAGGFVADFATPGDEDNEQDVYDITVGTSGNVSEADVDGDQTTYYFGPPRNQFSVDPVQDQVWGGEWAPDSSITVDVYESDESTLKGSASVVADGDGQFNVDLFALTVPVDVVAGDFVEVSDGVVVKDHTVTGLELTAVDDVADTVSGLAALGSSVWVNIHESGVADTVVVADGTTGVWVATFTGLIDPDTQGYAYQEDIDRDHTWINWPAPPPRQNFNVFFDELMVHAYQWADGVSVDLMVQHPDGVGGWDPAFHTDSQTSGVAPWDPSQTFAEFVIPDTVGVGDLVTVSGDGITKDHVVLDVSFTVDTDFDTVSGTGSPFADIGVNIHDDPGAQRHEVADGAGGFVADFSTPGDESPEEDDVYDITVGTSGNVSEADVDGDQTTYGFGPPPPPEQNFNVFVDALMVYAYQWADGVSVDLMVQHPDGVGGWDPAFHTDSQTSGVAPWDPSQTFAEFVVPDTVGVGDLVTVSGDGITKDHVVRDVSFTVDTDFDTVSGTGSPFADIGVNIHDDPGAQRHEVADGAGGFVADFATPGDEDYEQDVYDITVGTSGNVSESDVDGDQTTYYFGPPPNRPVGIAFYRSSNGRWYVPGQNSVGFTIAGEESEIIPVPGDYDGDGDEEFAFYRPSNARWYVIGQNSVGYGYAGEAGIIPVPADYDGDGADEFAFYRSANGRWYVPGQNSVGFTIAGEESEIIPVPGDYDGDGDEEFAFYRPSNARWYVIGQSSVGYGFAGEAGIIPVPADYDGDGADEFGFYRSSNGRWYVPGQNSVGFTIAGEESEIIPVPGDYDGDGDEEFAFYRPSNARWYVIGRVVGRVRVCG